MRILALDISTSSGWALLEDGRLLAAGSIKTPGPSAIDVSYPVNYWHAADIMAGRLVDKMVACQPDTIVIEETNGSKSRYTQKILEFIHCALLYHLMGKGWRDKIVYINTSDWRKVVGAHLSKEDKKQNAQLSKAKSAAKKSGKKLDKKKLGIRGRINKKHVAIRTANQMFNLELRPKDDDVADAICIAAAYHIGVPICNGK